MKLYLIRHTHAVDADAHVPDAMRWLSVEGRRVARAVGRKLAELDVELDAVISSPLVRAVQTAELIAEAVGYLGTVEASAALSPGAQPNVAAALLPSRGDAVAVVGHEPTMSQLGAFLVQRPAFPPFRKGQVAVLDQGQPQWYLHPERLEVDALLIA